MTPNPPKPGSVPWSSSKPVCLLLVFIAGLLYAVALKYFVIPAQIILTGTEGIAVSVSYYVDSTMVFIVLYAIFQSMLIAFAYKRISRTFAIRSLVVVLTVILGLLLLPEFRITQPGAYNERIMLVLFGGILAGYAKSIAFKNRGSTGDEDIVAAFYAMKYLRPVGSIAVIAGVVSTVFGLVLQYLKTDDLALVINTLMYTCLYIFVSTETLNNFYHKFKLTMLAVVSDSPELIGQTIKRISPHRTYTIQPGVGGHSDMDRSMVRTIVTLEELPKLLAAINAAAPDAFYYHHEIEGVSRKFYISPIG